MSKASRHYQMYFENDRVTNSVNRLSANIKFAGRKHGLKTISIVSPNKGEGKTMVVSNLAKSIASNGSSVLMVDADIYQHTIADIFREHRKDTIGNYFEGNCNIEDVIISTPIKNLYFLDLATYIKSIADLVNLNCFNSLMEILHNNFDYVIFDTPPVTPCVEGIIISSLCDETIIVVKEKGTTEESLDNALHQLKGANINILGCVLTFSKSNKHKYDYGY